MLHIIDLEALGMFGDTPSNANVGANDCSAVWNDAMATVKPGDTVLLPPGYCAFKSKPTPLPSSCLLKGSGSESHMVRCYKPRSDNEMFVTTGVTDCTVRDVRLWAADGSVGGTAIGRIATSEADAPFRTLIQSLETTRFNTGSFANGIKIDGVAGRAQYGARRIMMDDITLSGVTYNSLWLGGVNDAMASNLYVAGSAATWGTWIYGTKDNPSSLVRLDGGIGGTLLMYWTTSSMVTACALQSINTDNYCAGIQIKAGFLAKAPSLGGHGISVEANGGGKWLSAA